MRSVTSAPVVRPFADRLLRLDLPELDPVRRAASIDFAIRRIDQLPSVMRLGVFAIALGMRPFAVGGGTTGVRIISSRPLPLLGEYVRLVRSLTYAYVWETWPDTGPLGGAS